jgi:hypothetical protein
MTEQLIILTGELEGRLQDLNERTAHALHERLLREDLSFIHDFSFLLFSLQRSIRALREDVHDYRSQLSDTIFFEFVESTLVRLSKLRNEIHDILTRKFLETIERDFPDFDCVTGTLEGIAIDIYELEEWKQGTIHRFCSDVDEGLSEMKSLLATMRDQATTKLPFWVEIFEGIIEASA